MEFKIKAGTFSYNKQTKIAKIIKQKGLIHLMKNQKQQTHFKWINLQQNIQILNIILNKDDAVFEPVVGINNVYLLGFYRSDLRYFFWLQEEVDPVTVVKGINLIINFIEEQPALPIVDQAAIHKQNIKQVQPQIKIEAPQLKQTTLSTQPVPLIKLSNPILAPSIQSRSTSVLSLEDFNLKTCDDFKFLASVLGQKLRNPNFQPSKRELFIKQILQNLRPACSYKAYERIQKKVIKLLAQMNQIGKQKDLDQKYLKEQQKLLSNRKQKKLVSFKQQGKVDKYGDDINEDESQSESSYQDEKQDEYRKYQK